MSTLAVTKARADAGAVETTTRGMTTRGAITPKTTVNSTALPPTPTGPPPTTTASKAMATTEATSLMIPPTTTWITTMQAAIIRTLRRARGAEEASWSDATAVLHFGKASDIPWTLSLFPLITRPHSSPLFMYEYSPCYLGDGVQVGLSPTSLWAERRHGRYLAAGSAEQGMADESVLYWVLWLAVYPLLPGFIFVYTRAPPMAGLEYRKTRTAQRGRKGGRQPPPRPPCPLSPWG